jgi:hypothetical protein
MSAALIEGHLIPELGPKTLRTIRREEMQAGISILAS